MQNSRNRDHEIRFKRSLVCPGFGQFSQGFRCSGSVNLENPTQTGHDHLFCLPNLEDLFALAMLSAVS